ncbi:thioredoxin domain-containing protein [Marinifilum sp. D714]|uniref:thioredoxin family protein n=1 Tax=Marinifilum sp. D714 TaxID=2937523 RepID=UPI0027C7AD39|nr:thioredoxin domain-containing protein [Marinifilum sp. D714]MDQ2178437.1 thioredoxin domain-containing protein [Marinifilum sp. D714]
MKKLLGVMLAIFMSSSIFAQGIEFEHGTFAEALAKAKKENKMVFMDCYTTWCGPCKMLAKNIFPQKEVGDYFNAHFVNVKMDMEKGEGIELQKKYGVKAYPTLLFMDANGKVLHTKVGGSDAAGLIEEAKIAGDPSRQIGALEKKYAEGNRDPKFVAQYIKALYSAYKKEEVLAVGKDFIANCPKEKLANVDAFTVIGYSEALEFGSEAYKYIIANHDKLIAIEGIGQEDYDGIVGAAVNKYVSGIATTGTIEELKSAIEVAKKDFTAPQQKKMEDNWYSTYYLAHKEYDTWFNKKISSAKETLKTDKRMGAGILINTTYRVAMDPAFEGSGLYGKAITAVEDYMKEDSEMLACYYCLASLYKKSNNKDKALENINAFISKNAEKGGKNDKRVMALKEEIEKM